MPLPVSAPAPTPTHGAFDDRLAECLMPSPGPDFYIARRQLWLTPRPGRSRNLPLPPSLPADLDDLLHTEEALYIDSCWNKGIGKIWTGFSKGAHLKYRLPLGLVIKIVHASWLRDETWPIGMQAPEPDDELPDGSITQTAVPVPGQTNHTPSLTLS